MGFFSVCFPGYWGSNCSNICTCTPGESCDPEDGTCSWSGENNSNGENNSEYNRIRSPVMSHFIFRRLQLRVKRPTVELSTNRRVIKWQFRCQMILLFREIIAHLAYRRSSRGYFSFSRISVRICL